MAMMNTAIYDAVNAASAMRFRPYHYDGPAILGAIRRTRRRSAATVTG